MRRNIVLFILLVALSTCVFGQKKITQGKLIINMEAPDSAKKSKGMVDFIPNGTILYFKDSMSRMEMNTKMGTMIIIYNSKTDESISCMDMNGKKIAMKQTGAQLGAMMAMVRVEKPQIKVTDETKKIAGFKCKRVVVTRKMGSKEFSSDSWYASELAVPQMKQDEIDSVEGYPLETITSRDGMYVKMTCQSFEKMTPPDSLFVLPAGYEEMDMGKLMKTDDE